jgi:hypothetical protein
MDCLIMGPLLPWSINPAQLIVAVFGFSHIVVRSKGINDGDDIKEYTVLRTSEEVYY